MTATARGLADEARGTGVPQGSGSRLVVSDVAHPLEAMFAACIIHRVTFATHLHFNLELWPSGDADGRGVCCTAHRGMWRSGGAMWIRSRCGAYRVRYGNRDGCTHSGAHDRYPDFIPRPDETPSPNGQHAHVTHPDIVIEICWLTSSTQ